MKSKILPWLSAFFIRAIAATLRMTIDDRGGIMNQPNHAPAILAFWHNRTFLMVIFYETYCRGRTSLTFISRSRDGQFMTDVAAHFGVKAVRGSSSRHGASAALAALRGARNEHNDITLTPDGPRGPRYQVHPGIIRLAQATGRPIVALSHHLGWKYELRSWDRFQIPIPFSTCHLTSAPPIHVPKHASDEELAAIVRQLQETLGGD